MGLSTERKVFVAVLAVAGAALVIDRGILGPSEASASADPAVLASEAALPEAPVSSNAPARSSETMAKVLMERLEGIQSQQGSNSLSDAFSLEKFMSEPVKVDDAALSTEPEENISPVFDLIVADAPSMPELSAVMPSSKGGGAVLNGKLVRVGGQVNGGFTLIEVRERSVVLELDGRKYPLEMPMQTRP